MPRQTSIPCKDIIEFFSSDKQLASFTEIPGKRHPFWSHLSDQILQTYVAKPETIYCWFIQNRYSLRDLFFEKTPTQFQRIQTDGCSSSISSESSEDDSDKKTGDHVETNLYSSHDEWTKICPGWVNYHDAKLGSRRRLVLERGSWTHLISQKFYENTKLPCCLKFLYNKVSTDDDDNTCSVTFEATCKSCRSKLRGSILNLSIFSDCKEDIPIKISYDGSFNVNHPKLKRQLSGKKNAKK